MLHKHNLNRIASHFYDSKGSNKNSKGKETKTINSLSLKENATAYAEAKGMR